MREQLPKMLRYLSYFPSILSLIFLIFSFGYGVVAIDVKDNVGYVSLFLSFIFLISFVGKEIADVKLKKLRHGINPLYVVKKNPANLDAQVTMLMSEGYGVKSKTETTAHMEKKPYLSVLTVIVLFLFGIIPGVIYLVWYSTQPNEVVLLDVSTQS